MPRHCTVCDHPQRAAIDQALVSGEAFRPIAARYGLSTGALVRHRTDHIPVALVQAQEAGEVARADDLLAAVRDLQERTLAILSSAEEEDDHALALRAIGEARKNLELLARLVGDLDDRPQVAILVSPEWVALRSQIMRALAPFPEARVAAAEVINAAG